MISISREGVWNFLKKLYELAEKLQPGEPLNEFYSTHLSTHYGIHFPSTLKSDGFPETMVDATCEVLRERARKVPEDLEFLIDKANAMEATHEQQREKMREDISRYLDRVVIHAELCSDYLELNKLCARIKNPEYKLKLRLMYRQLLLNQLGE